MIAKLLIAFRLFKINITGLFHTGYTFDRKTSNMSAWASSLLEMSSLLFGEYLKDELLLRLPHRHMVFTLPKLLRIFLKNDKALFSELSRMIFSLINNFYSLAAGRTIITGCVLCYQSFGDLLRHNSHYHGVFLDGGYD